MRLLVQAAQAAVQSAVNSSFHSVLNPPKSTWVNCSQPPEKLGQLAVGMRYHLHLHCLRNVCISNFRLTSCCPDPATIEKEVQALTTRLSELHTYAARAMGADPS